MVFKQRPNLLTIIQRDRNKQKRVVVRWIYSCKLDHWMNVSGLSHSAHNSRRPEHAQNACPHGDEDKQTYEPMSCVHTDCWQTSPQHQDHVQQFTRHQKVLVHAADPWREETVMKRLAIDGTTEGCRLADH